MPTDPFASPPPRPVVPTVPLAPTPPAVALHTPPSIAPNAAVSHPAFPAAIPVAPTPGISPGLVVLQWLVYAFWGWCILATSVLIAVVLANLISGIQTGQMALYGLAAVLVLLPISLVCDVLFSKKEPVKKQGASSTVMVVHTVIFALFGIGALISVVFSLVNLLTSSSDKSGVMVTMYSAFIIATLYGAIFLRTIVPSNIKLVRKVCLIYIGAVIGVISVLAIAGPVVSERATRNDRLVEENIASVVTEISNYSFKNSMLPEKLSDLSLSGNTKVLLDKNLLDYTANARPDAVKTIGDSTKNYSQIYYYQLCANFARPTSKNTPVQVANNEYSDYIASSEHTAGQNCYKLKTRSY